MPYIDMNQPWIYMSSHPDPHTPTSLPIAWFRISDENKKYGFFPRDFDSMNAFKTAISGQ